MTKIEIDLKLTNNFINKYREYIENETLKLIPPDSYTKDDILFKVEIQDHENRPLIKNPPDVQVHKGGFNIDE